MRALLSLFLVALVAAVLACSSESEATRSPTTAFATATPPPAAQPTFARPPVATAASGGLSVTMGIGTYCWSAKSSNGVCVDSAGPVTGLDELIVSPGASIDVTTAFPGADITDAVASAAAVNALRGNPVGLDSLVWNFPPVDGQQLKTTRHATGVNFAAPLVPGRYVVSVFIRPTDGDVAYGVVLDVQ